MAVMNSFVEDTLDKIATEAGKLCDKDSKLTMTSLDIRTAIRLIQQGTLVQNAMCAGNDAIFRYVADSPVNRREI